MIGRGAPTRTRKTRKSVGRPSTSCDHCGKTKNKRGKYCSDKCRQAAFRARKKATA